MKKLSILFIFSLLLFASTGFWQQLIDIENRFYAQRDLNTSAQEYNTSISQNNDVIDAKFDAFTGLISMIKEQPFRIQNTKNIFFDPSKSDEQFFKLTEKIRINRQYGYDLAIERDQIRIDTLKLQRQMYIFFASLSANWTDLNSEEFDALLTTEYTLIKALPLKKYEQQYANLSDTTSEVTKSLKTNLDTLQKHYYFYQEFLSYLTLNPNLLHYTSLLQNLQLGSIIATINENDIAANINTLLRYVHLDLGRLSLFMLTLLLSWGLGIFIYHKVYTMLKRIILREQNEHDDILLSNIEHIRKPLLLLIVTFGLELALEILRYPSTSEHEVLFFYFIYLGTISYIIISLINNFFFHFMIQHAQTKNKEVRRELINLVLSIIKIVVILMAGLLFLVRLGVNISGLLASLGIGGLAVALAAKDTLSNFFGLIKIIADNSFSQGDWIATGSVEGTVVEIGFVSTNIRTFDNALITVPNATLANSALKNWNRRRVGRRIKMNIGVTYGADRKQLASAVDAIREMLYEHPGIASEKKYDQNAFKKRYQKAKKLVSFEDKQGIKTTLLVYVDQLSASSIDILIYAFSNTVNWQEWLIIKEDVIFKIWEILEERDLEFAFPSQSIYFDKKNIEDTLPTVKKAKDLPEGT
ncbi:MAG: hypothetical protein DRG24_00135 [Epsilonproteobacteria bacterium]|nr:MAG: hypothetical protein DRG24_00135 [Campylobacterota bacterium]